MTPSTPLQCTCGQTHLMVEGAPIICAECLCNSCRTAGDTLQKLPKAPRVLESTGGTRFVLYRKDRVRFLQGAHLLKEFRLKPDSPTRRVVATCCNTPVFLEFQSGHWLSLYGCLWPAGSLPRMELRTMASDLPSGTSLPNDLPNSNRQSASFMAKLLGAWIAMGFRSPKITVVNGALDA